MPYFIRQLTERLLSGCRILLGYPTNHRMFALRLSDSSGLSDSPKETTCTELFQSNKKLPNYSIIHRCNSGAFQILSILRIALVPASDDCRKRKADDEIHQRQEGINHEHFLCFRHFSEDNLPTSCEFHDPQTSQERSILDGSDHLRQQ